MKIEKENEESGKTQYVVSDTIHISNEMFAKLKKESAELIDAEDPINDHTIELAMKELVEEKIDQEVVQVLNPGLLKHYFTVKENKVIAEVDTFRISLDYRGRKLHVELYITLKEEPPELDNHAQNLINTSLQLALEN